MTILATRMQEITHEINETLEVLHVANITIGKLLTEARSIILDDGQKHADFLAYCNDEFSLGKAQTYKLIKVADVFGNDERFNGSDTKMSALSTNVLYSLATQATDEQIDEAFEIASNGGITTTILNKILFPEPVSAPEKKESKEVIAASELETSLSIESIPDKVTVVIKGDIINEASPETISDKVSSLKQAEAEGLQSEISELRKALQAATDLIATLQSEKVVINKGSSAPFLPQFKNACPYAVLGLGQTESKKVTHVRKAFRELIKCGYGDGHKAFELIVKAKDLLMDDINAEKENK